MGVRRRLARAAALASVTTLLACAGSAPDSVFATGNYVDTNEPPGTLFQKMRSASAHMPRPKPPPPAPVAAAPKLDLELLKAISETRGFRLGSPSRMTPTPDGRAVLFLRSAARDPKQSLFKIDLASGDVREILSPEKLSRLPENLSAEERARRERMRVRATGLTSFELSADGLTILVPFGGRLFVFDRMTGQTHELSTGEGAILDPKLSPDGKRVAYVRNWDLWMIDVDGKSPEVRLTRGGTEAKSNGLAEFIAQEELDRSSGFFWSPDGKQLCFEEADQSQVERLSLVDVARPEGAPDRAYYPRAGHTNAQVRFGVIAARADATPTWLAWDRAKLPYVAGVRWEPNAPLVLTLLDRDQKHLQLVSADPVTGKTKPIASEQDEAFIETDETVPRFLSNGRDYVWSATRDGDTILELRSVDTPADAPGRPITKKGFGYRRLLDVDFDRGRVIVEASAEPTEASVYAVGLSGGEPALIGSSPGVVRASFGRSHEVYASYEASTTHWPAYFAVGVDKKRTPIPSVAERPPFAPNVEIVKVGADEVRVAVVRPRGFVPGARVPVIDDAYGGPGALVATADAVRHVRAQFIADATGAIVVAIDAKGTPHRGRDWARAIAGQLGEVPTAGHVQAIRDLAKTIPELDLSRVAIYGWSYGGFLACYAALTHPTFFKAAVCGAPVADWREYDTAYTERYLGAPGVNPAAYDASSLLALAKKSTTVRPFLVIHGTVDDNVYFGGSVRLVEALTAAHHDVRFLPLAGQTHLVSGLDASLLVWRETAEFLSAHLKTAPQDLENPYRL